MFAMKADLHYLTIEHPTNITAAELHNQSSDVMQLIRRFHNIHVPTAEQTCNVTIQRPPLTQQHFHGGSDAFALRLYFKQFCTNAITTFASISQQPLQSETQRLIANDIVIMATTLEQKLEPYATAPPGASNPFDIP